MLVVNKLTKKECPDGIVEGINKVVLRPSRVEIVLTDGSSRHYYTKDSYMKDDQLEIFAVMMRNKFLDGKDKRSASPQSKSFATDLIDEMQQEILDFAAYGAVHYFVLEEMWSLIKGRKDEVLSILKESGVKFDTVPGLIQYLTERLKQ